MTIRSSIHNFLVIFLGVLLVNCVGTRYLDEGEYLLYEQKIKNANRISEDELSDFYRQEPNRRLPIIPVAPFVWLYQIGLKNYDTEKIDQEISQVQKKYDRKIAKARDNGNDRRADRLEGKKENKVSKLKREQEEGTLFMRWGEPLSVYDSSKAEVTRTQMESYLHTKGFFEGKVTHEGKIDGRQVSSIYPNKSK